LKVFDCRHQFSFAAKTPRAPSKIPEKTKLPRIAEATRQFQQFFTIFFDPLGVLGVLAAP
jgi:hypothetical protein